MTDFGRKTVYQVYPKSFRDSDGDGFGDIRGIIEKLDYLKELEIDYLWITPVFISPMNDNGYDVADYYKINPQFGTMEDMDELIRECDNRGIGLMLDMVFNHTSTEHEWFRRALAGEKKYQDYYIFRDEPEDQIPTNWQSKFGGPAWEYVPSLKKWYLHLYDDRIALKKLFETWQMGMQDGDGWNALFWCNHDQPRVVSRMGNEDLYWKESAKMLAAAIHMMRGTPYVYQGEELGMTNAHYNDISQYRDVESLNYYKILLDQGKTKEQALKVLAARSRDNSRTPMQWSDDKNAGFTEGTPWIEAPENYKEINAETELKDPDSIYSFYKKLIALRKEKDIIAEGTIEFLEKENADVLAYRRNYQGEELIVLNNLTAENVTIRQQPEWKAYQKRLGNYEKITAEDGKITLRPFETIVLDSAL